MDKTGLLDVTSLVEDVEFAQEILLVFLRQTFEAFRLSPVNAANVPKPIVDQAKLLVQQRGADTTASVVPNYHDMLNLQHVDGVLNDRQAVEIGMIDNVGDVAMNKDLARP